jgi:hypothetical protein
MANQIFGTAQKVRNREFPKTNNPAGLRFTFPFNTFAITSYEYQLQLQPVGLEWITGCYFAGYKSENYGPGLFARRF